MSIAKYAIHSPVKLRPQHSLAPPHPPSAQRGFHGSSDVPPVSSPHHGSRIEAGDSGFSGGGAHGRLVQPAARSRRPAGGRRTPGHLPRPALPLSEIVRAPCCELVFEYV